VEKIAAAAVSLTVIAYVLKHNQEAFSFTGVFKWDLSLLHGWSHMNLKWVWD